MEQRDLHATVRRLLATGQPELSCEQCFDELDRYVEAEVAGAEADAAVKGLRAHLEGCPACAQDHTSLLALVRIEPGRIAGGVG
jgi:hypothetical protein